MYTTPEDMECSEIAYAAIKRLIHPRAQQILQELEGEGADPGITRFGGSWLRDRGYVPHNHLLYGTPFDHPRQSRSRYLSGGSVTYGEFETWYDRYGDLLFLGDDGRFHLATD